MRAIRPNNRRAPLWTKLLLGFGILLVGGVGTVAALGALKIIDLHRLAFWSKPKTYPADWLEIPICNKTVPPYTAVTDEYLTVLHAPPDQAQKFVEKGILISYAQVRRRVTARQHEVGKAFTENDLLPKGSRPGVAGGTPPGKVAITLDASKMQGVFGLKEGDHVDLLADIPVDKLSWFGGSDGGVAAIPVHFAPHGDKDKPQTETRVLARDAVTISPVITRAKPVASSSLTQGIGTHTVPVQEIVFAVGEEEVARVTKSMDCDLQIMCAAHSGRPEEKEPEPAPPGPVAVPVLVREIPAFTELTEADFRDPVTQRVRYQSASLLEVNRRGIVPNLSDLLGRVVKRHMLVGRMIMEEDLLPPGSPPGITGGIGPDRQAMAIEADKILGVENLRAGDRLDVLASFDLGEEHTKKETEKLPDGTVRVIESQVPSFRSSRLSSDASLGGRAEHWFIAIDAELIVPVGTAVNLPAAAPSDKHKSQVVIALDARDMPSMAQRMAAKNIVLNAVARPAGKNRVTVGKPLAPPGKVAVMVAPKALPAFEALTKESLINLETRREAWRVLDAQTVAAEHVIADPDLLVGRVLNKEKRQGEAFVEADLLPAWVKPGLAARVPPGKRAVVVGLFEQESEEKVERALYSETKTKTERRRASIEGLEQVTEGAHIDLLVSRPVQYGSNIVVHAVGTALANRFRVASIVRDGILAYRTPTDAVLAVDPEEVVPLQEALASHAGVRTVLYSAQSRDTKSEPPLAGSDGTERAQRGRDDDGNQTGGIPVRWRKITPQARLDRREVNREMNIPTQMAPAR